MKISISVEGKTDMYYPDGEGFGSVGKPEVYVAGQPQQPLDVQELLLHVAGLVPNGTRLMVTVETVS